MENVTGKTNIGNESNAPKLKKNIRGVAIDDTIDLFRNNVINSMPPIRAQGGISTCANSVELDAVKTCIKNVNIVLSRYPEYELSVYCLKKISEFCDDLQECQKNQLKVEFTILSSGTSCENKGNGTEVVKETETGIVENQTAMRNEDTLLLTDAPTIIPSTTVTDNSPSPAVGSKRKRGPENENEGRVRITHPTADYVINHVLEEKRLKLSKDIWCIKFMDSQEKCTSAKWCESKGVEDRLWVYYHFKFIKTVTSRKRISNTPKTLTMKDYKTRREAIKSKIDKIMLSREDQAHKRFRCMGDTKVFIFKTSPAFINSTMSRYRKLFAIWRDGFQNTRWSDPPAIFLDSVKIRNKLGYTFFAIDMRLEKLTTNGKCDVPESECESEEYV